MINEKQLINEVKMGSEQSYNLLYNYWISTVYRFIYQYVKSEIATDDIVQETFLCIWKNRENLNPDLSFKSYLFTISYRLLLKEIRRQLNNPLMEEFMDYQYTLITSEHETEKNLEFDDFILALAKVKQKLSPRQREIFEMSKELNLTIAEISNKLSISEQVVRNQLSAALKIVRADLKQFHHLLLLFLLNF